EIAVASQSREEQRSQINKIHVPEPRYQYAPFHIPDHLLDRRRSARHHEASRLRDRIRSHFFCPEARITQGFHNAALDPDRPTLRKTILAEYRFRRDRIIRIGIDGDRLVEEPFAELVAAALFAEKTPSLIGGTGFHHPEHWEEEISDRRGF